jgi:large subunit ribosomal protein L30
MAKVIITQIKSAIDRPARQKATIQALGIKKLYVPVEKELTPNIAGMIRAVGHMLKVEHK